MSQRNNFSGGFLLGSIVGGVLGGVLGAVLTKQLGESPSPEARLNPDTPEPKLKERKAKKRSLAGANGSGDIEAARRSLEDKIAQLNDAIDDVRQQLGGIDSPPTVERSPLREP